MGIWICGEWSYMDHMQVEEIVLPDIMLSMDIVGQRAHSMLYCSMFVLEVIHMS